MIIFLITTLVWFNVISVLLNYKEKNYKTAILNSFILGVCFIALLEKLV